MQGELTKRKAPFGGVPVPVQTAICFILLSVVLTLLEATVVGIRTGAWKYLIAGFWYLVLIFWLIDHMIKLEKWAWWLAVALSSALSIRAVLAVLAWIRLRRQGLGPDPQSLVFHALCCIALGAVVSELGMRASRDAFGIHAVRRRSANSGSTL